MCKKKRFCNDNYTIVCKSNYANIFITFHINQKRSTTSTYHNFCSLLCLQNHNLYWRKNKISKYIYFRISIPISFITMFYRNISQIFQTGIFAIIQLMKLRSVTNLPTTLYGMIMMCVHIVLRTLFIFTFIFFVCYFFFISFRENRVSETWLTEY